MRRYPRHFSRHVNTVHADRQQAKRSCRAIRHVWSLDESSSGQGPRAPSTYRRRSSKVSPGEGTASGYGNGANRMGLDEYIHVQSRQFPAEQLDVLLHS